MGGCPSSRRSTFSPSPEPPAGPVPVSATFGRVSQNLAVTFDQLLVPGVTDMFNWTMTVDLGPGPRVLIGGAPGAVAASTATIPMVDVVGGAGPDRCTYAAFPPDIVGLVSGLPAAAFVDFPVTLIP